MKPDILTIITVNLNNNNGLINTIKSIISQTAFEQIEWIVVDGGSNDGSLNTILAYSSYMDYFVSEEDAGVYDAMNKGILHSHGEYVLFMNSGDCLHDDTVVEIFINSDLFGNYDYIIGKYSSASKGKIIRNYNPPCISTAMSIIKQNIPHQATFIKLDRFKKMMYDTKYKVMADKKFFFIDMVLNKASYAPLNLDVAIFDTSGISCSGLPIVKKEFMKYFHETLPPLVAADYNKWLEGENSLQKYILAIPPNTVEIKLLTFCALLLRFFCKIRMRVKTVLAKIK